jgi:hypothetical protein
LKKHWRRSDHLFLLRSVSKPLKFDDHWSYIKFQDHLVYEKMKTRFQVWLNLDKLHFKDMAFIYMDLNDSMFITIHNLFLEAYFPFKLCTFLHSSSFSVTFSVMMSYECMNDKYDLCSKDFVYYCNVVSQSK